MEARAVRSYGATAALACGILFLSGASALIFETLWLRLSGLVFGNSVWAAALILSSFMTGLALGTAIAAAAKLRGLRPLLIYATLEVMVAVLGCAIVFIVPSFGYTLGPVFRALWGHQSLMSVFRFSLCFAILVLPSTAMGLTLPLLLDEPIFRLQEFRRAIGLFYGFNTLGAVAGTLATEAFLIRAVGLYGTAIVAGSFNIAAALAALAIAAKWRAPAEDRPLRRLVISFAYRLPWRLLVASFGAGAILLCLEVVWFRFLRLYVASSATAFAIMLAVVLVGIALGGLGSSMIKRQSELVLASLFLGAALLALLSYVFFPLPALQRYGGANWQDFYFDSWREITCLALALMLPVSLISGVLFPAITSRVQEVVSHRMNSTGITTLFNTAGAAVGPLLASFVFLPTLGFQSSLLLCAAGYVACSILVSPKWPVCRWQRVVLSLLAAASLTTVGFFPWHRAEQHFAHAREPYSRDGSRLVRRIEGSADTIQLLRRDFLGQPYYHRLLTNAFTMSDTRPRNQRYMRLFAYLPLAMLDRPENALLICYGCGVTADALRHSRELRHIDVVDVSKEVLALADNYAGSPNPLRDPRVSTFVQDGRFFLQATGQKYDIITGEPPPPKTAGTVNLYTQQFFSLMHDRLNDGGIVTFWLPIYQLRVEEAKAILRAFHAAFPNCAVFTGPDEEWIMLGIKGELHSNAAEAVGRLFADQATRADLERIGVETPKQLAAFFLMSAEDIQSITADTAPLTDFFPRRLTDAPPHLASVHEFSGPYMDGLAAARRFNSCKLTRTIWSRDIARGIESYFVIRGTRYRAQINGANWLAELDLYLRHSTLRSPVLEVLGTDEMRVATAKASAANNSSPLPEVLPELVADALAGRDFGRAIAALEAKHSSERNDLLLLIYLYCVNGAVAKAEALAAAASPVRDPLLDWLWAKLQAEYGFAPPT